MKKQDNTDTIAVVRRVTWTGAVANVLLAAVKVVVGWMSRSQALLADGVHSLSDLVTDAAVLVGSQYWSAEPDSEHPYGHGRIETIVSIGIGAALVGVSAGIMWRALGTMTRDHVTPPGWPALIVAIVSILTKESLFRWTAAAGGRVRCRALVANAWHHRSDALSSVPVAVAVLGGRIFPQFTYLDHIAAVVVGVMLLRAAWRIAGPGISELMESRCGTDISDVLANVQKNHPEIHEIHKVRGRRVGGACFIDLHMLVDAAMSVGDSHDLAEALKQTIVDHEPSIADVTVHVEPAEPAKGGQ
ncbi:cation diffusion facilitator family transporter [Verrucomicrobiota bacterium]